MADSLSLEQLVHLSLGDPEAGAVNFNLLKTLLLQMLKAMNLYNFQPNMTDDDQRAVKEALTISSNSTTPSKRHVKFDEKDGTGSTSIFDESADEHQDEAKRKSRRKKRDRSLERLNALEEKVFRFESQLNALDQIPSNDELINRAKQVQRKTSDPADSSTKGTTRQGPILEVWQYTQLEKRLESAENGITRLASLIQDLLSDMSDLKESHETIKQTTDDLKKQQDEMKKLLDKLNQEKNDWAKKSDVDNLEEKIRNLQNLLSSLRDRIEQVASNNNGPVTMPDFSGLVTWDRLEDALRGIRESIERSSTDAAAALASSRDQRAPVTLIDRPSQTSAKSRESRQRRSTSAASTDIPSDHLSELLEQLGTLNQRHEQLRALVEALERKKLNRDEFDALKDKQSDLYDRLTALERLIEELRAKQKSDAPAPVREIIKEVSTQKTDYSNDMADFRTALQRLREDLDRLKQLIQDLINKGNLSSQEIEALKQSLAQLDQAKADKTMMYNELDRKADKRELDSRVLKKEFQTTCNELSQSLNDYMQKFNTHDDAQKNDLDKMNQDIDGKIDRSELDAMRDYIEKQMKKLKKLAKDQQQIQPHVHMMSEDEAAGLRKQLIRFHCISCDRPIDVQPHPQQPSLPANQGMRPIQSPRPYTTYELDQIRQYQKSQQFSNELSGGLADVYATVRQCGGSHTMTLPFKRQIKTQPTVPEESILSRSEVDIKGHDGVIYKGRIDVGKLPTVDMQKKNSVVLLTPAPPQRPRSESHPRSAHYPTQADLTNNDRQNEPMTHVVPNIEPALPREQTFT